MSQPLENVVLFDGDCRLCAASVQFILRHDPGGTFRYASFQSETGRQFCRQHGLNPEQFDSVVLITRDGVRVRSDAALAIVGQLGGAWRGVAALRVIPRPVRDWCYGVVARNRHRWFGRSASCRVPPDDAGKRFLP